jgi:hypothetical protein
LQRLRVLKAQYDPDNVFNQNFPIPPVEGELDGASAGTSGGGVRKEQRP